MNDILLLKPGELFLKGLGSIAERLIWRTKTNSSLVSSIDN